MSNRLICRRSCNGCVNQIGDGMCKWCRLLTSFTSELDIEPCAFYITKEQVKKDLKYCFKRIGYFHSFNSYIDMLEGIREDGYFKQFKD